MIKTQDGLKMTEMKSTELIFVCFAFLIHGSVTAFNCTSPTPKALFAALEQNLFPEKLVRPVNSFEEPINITISITVVGILGVDEKAQTLTTVLWRILEWNIAGLSWDEKTCGTARVSFPREKIWVPDIYIAEFMDEDKAPKTPYVYLDNTGHVFDDKPIRVVSSCKLGIFNFPFDVQNCTLTFGSYLHIAKDVRVIVGSSSEAILKESRSVLYTEGEWELADITVAPSTLALEEGSYSEIKYYIILRRRPILYVVNLLIPSCFLVTVDLFSFLLPPQSVDRSAFKMTLILGYTVFLLIMNDLLPVTGDTTPLINVFFSVSLALMVVSLLETVIITNIQLRSCRYNEVPRWLSVLVLRYLAVLVCLPPNKPSKPKTVFLHPPSAEPSGSHLQSVSGCTPVKPPQAPPDPGLDELRTLSRHLRAIRLQVDKHFEGNSSSLEWQKIGMVIDRLLFGFYIVFISVGFITIISIWIWSNSYSR